GRLCGGIETVTLSQSHRHAIVIASDVYLPPPECAHRVEDLIGLRAIANEVAEADDAGEFLAPDVAHHGPQRFSVRGQGADDERPQDDLRVRLRGNSWTMRSTISIGVSSSRMSRMMSDIL